MRRHSRDRRPRWVTLRWPTQCRSCGAELSRGEAAFYYPNGRATYGESCCDAATIHARQFEAAELDELAARAAAGY